MDQFLARLELGNIAFNAPDSLNLYDTAEIELLLSLVTPVEQLKQLIKAEGERIGAQIRVSDRMEARLTGPNFSITAVTPETQAVSESDRTRWQWEVKPNDVGPQKLHLTLSALLTIEGNSTPRAIRTFDKVIDVHVRWHQRATSFVEENWQWLWAVVLAPVAAWVWNKLRRRTAQP